MPDGSCPKGHTAADVSNTYETDPAPEAPMTAAAPADAAPADSESAASIQPEPDPDPHAPADPDAPAESVPLPEADTVRLKAADLAAAVAFLAFDDTSYVTGHTLGDTGGVVMR